MNTNNDRNERDLIDIYREKGYTAHYRFQNGKLIDNNSKESFTPQEVYVVAEHRFEGISNPSDMSVLYVLETETHSKGTCLVGYGPTGNLEALEFFKEIPEMNISDDENVQNI